MSYLKLILNIVDIKSLDTFGRKSCLFLELVTTRFGDLKVDKVSVKLQKFKHTRMFRSAILQHTIELEKYHIQSIEKL